MTHEPHHFAGRLIALIESHAEELTRGTVEQLQASSRTPSYHGLSYRDLHERVFDVYHDFGHWLLEKTEGAVRGKYYDLGVRRSRERIPLSEVLWALVLTKNYLGSYLAAWALSDSAVELYRQQELDRLITHFFDRAMCYAAEGYEHPPDAESLEEESLSAARRRSGAGWVL
ncbi:MAG TPA: hypothetical protein VEJ67_01490 [Candidatus Cybelea sp.]|nr:hypothetical protein [Candidatus Cybelea sp.]